MTMQMLYVATHVRPDIGLGVGLLTCVQAWPHETLLKHAERIMIYLKSTSTSRPSTPRTATPPGDAPGAAREHPRVLGR